LLAVALSLTLLAGCTTNSVDDLAPQSATLFPAAPDSNPLETARMASADIEGDIAARHRRNAPSNSGEYPNLNITPGIAAPQFTKEEAAAKKAALKVTAAQVQAETAGEKAKTDTARLRKLAREHGKEALNEIEGE
jgi:hypothetical protein